MQKIGSPAFIFWSGGPLELSCFEPKISAFSFPYVSAQKHQIFQMFMTNLRLIPKTCISMPIALFTPRARYVHSVQSGARAKQICHG